MLIGELSKRSGFSRDTIRYYEKLQILTIQQRRSDNQYKHYGQEAIERLQNIQQLKEVGFTLDEIRHFLEGEVNQHPCKELPVQLAKKLDKIDNQIALLMKVKTALLKMKANCDGECSTQQGLPSCVPPIDVVLPKNTCC